MIITLDDADLSTLDSAVPKLWDIRTHKDWKEQKTRTIKSCSLFFKHIKPIDSDCVISTDALYPDDRSKDITTIVTHSISVIG